MKRSLQRRLWVLLVSAAAALAVWKSVPGTALDFKCLTTLTHKMTRAPLKFSGAGSHAAPWAISPPDPASQPAPWVPPPLPTMVALGDDAEGFFQASPPAPIDMAVIFQNLHRLGVKKTASAAVLAWDAPDAIALAALEKSMGIFESLVLAAPLSRGASSSPMPAAFRRASLPLTAVTGEISKLPLVNRIPVPGVILAGETTLAGFSTLESETEPTDRSYPLLARWEDRVMLSFPLVVLLQRLELPLENVRVSMGNSISLSANGPVFELDEFGRVALPPAPVSVGIPAKELIDAPADFLPQPASEWVILRDDQSAADPASRAFSGNLASVFAAFSREKAPPPPPAPRVISRLAPAWELGILAVLVAMLTLLSGGSHLLRFFGSLLLVAASLAAQQVAFRDGLLWLPGLAMLAAIATAFLTGTLVSRNVRRFLKLEPAPLREIPAMPTEAAAGSRRSISKTLPALPVAEPPQKPEP